MSRAPSSHVRYRELISGRLDGSLTHAEADELARHLAGCPRCRQAERAFREQRLRLRSLRTIAPPRDMWARTSAALDREVARTGRRRLSRRRTRTLAGGAAVASVAAVGLSMALIANGIAPAVVTSPTGSVGLVARATPFTIPSEALAFLGSGVEGLSIYRTHVDHVCPATAIDCLDEERNSPAMVTLPRDLQPSNLSMSPSGSQLAVQGRSAGGGDVIAVVLMPVDEAPPDTEAASPPGQTTRPNAPEQTRTPAALPTETGQQNSPRADVTPEPLASGDPTAGAAVASSLTSGPSMDPMATAAAAQAVVAILDDVYSVGAPPAWSADGTLLAFSAMPADLRHGPDVYVWRAGDQRAQPLTDDHASYFASWAGSRIVASRVALPQDEEAGRVRVTTVAIDPETAEERSVDAAGTWLPQVDPTGTNVVVWHGSLEWDESGPEAASGALYVGAWSALDPFVETGADAQATAGASPGTAPDASADPAAATSPDVEGNEGEAEAGGETTPPDDGATPASDNQQDRDSDESDDPARALPDGFVAVEPSRDPVRDPVRDWQVRWSLDGLVLGYWIADVPGSSWGELVVVPVDATTGDPAAEPLLQPSLARRAFTLGSNRVAWVAPADDEPEGELRIRAWGPDGFGDLRLRPGQLEQGAPAN